MQVFKFRICFVNHQGVNKEEVITIKEESGDLELAKVKADIIIQSTPTDRIPGSIDNATAVKVKTIELIQD